MAVKFKDGKCIKCGTPYSYSEKYDSEFCPICDEWLIDRCGDPDCEFCKDRPEKPSNWFNNLKKE